MQLGRLRVYDWSRVTKLASVAERILNLGLPDPSQNFKNTTDLKLGLSVPSA